MQAQERRWFWIELGLIVVGLVLATLPFWLTGLDIQVARWFFRPEAADPWPLRRHWLWECCYQGPGVVGGLFLACGLGGLLAGWWRCTWRSWRPVGLFLILSLAIGPGVITNLVLKDHWGRPRPKQILELGGNRTYQPPLFKGKAGTGYSFPAGHATIGFVWCAFAFPLRRRRPVLAMTVLCGSVVLGGIFGLGRMVAGGHFLSDVLWAGLVTYLGCFLAWHGLRPDRPVAERHRSWLVIWLGLGLTVAAVVGLLLATPYGRKPRVFTYSSEVVLPSRLVVEMPGAQVTIRPVRPEDGDVRLYARVAVNGFGLPTNRVDITSVTGPEVHRIAIRPQGWFTEFDANCELIVDPRWFKTVQVRVGQGQVRSDPSLPAGLVEVVPGQEKAGELP